jgi:hypothetical protein
MRLAEKGGSFDFWKEAAEDIYSAEDGEPVWRLQRSFEETWFRQSFGLPIWQAQRCGPL